MVVVPYWPCDLEGAIGQEASDTSTFAPGAEGLSSPPRWNRWNSPSVRTSGSQVRDVLNSVPAGTRTLLPVLRVVQPARFPAKQQLEGGRSRNAKKRGSSHFVTVVNEDTNHGF